MYKYGDVTYIQEDIERIIENKEWRLAELADCWESITEHMECGEIRDLRQSCIDDEIILSCLQKEKYYDSLIETFKQKNKELNDAAEKLADNIPVCNNLIDGNYVFQFKDDIWEFETAYAFYKRIVETYPNSSFTMLPYGMELIKSDKTN